MASLLPPNATPQEQALDNATARIGAVPVPMRELWNPDTCPVDLLPWLAWALSLDNWDSTWPESVKRQRIRQAVSIQRHKGTAKSVRDVASSFGAAISVQEWWQTSPQGTPHTFTVLLTVGGDVPATTAYQNAIQQEIDRVKPVRSHYTLQAGVSASGAIGLQGVARPAIYRRLTLNEA